MCIRDSFSIRCYYQSDETQEVPCGKMWFAHTGTYRNKVDVLSRNPHAKRERQGRLLEKLKEDTFMTDEDIAAYLDVSIPTVRLDRLELGIPELRQRIRDVASQNHGKVRSLKTEEIV